MGRGRSLEGLALFLDIPNGQPQDSHPACFSLFLRVYPMTGGQRPKTLSLEVVAHLKTLFLFELQFFMFESAEYFLFNHATFS